MDRSFISLSLIVVFAFGISAAIPGCASNRSSLRAQGTVADRTLTTRVDHPVARDYLEGRPLPADVEELRRNYVEVGRAPSRQALAYLTSRYSPDVATLFFLEAVSAHDASEAIQRDYALAVTRLMRTAESPRLDVSNERLTVAFAPGWFYQTYGSETGADFQKQLALLARLGVPAELIQTPENGSVETNAEIIAESLRRLGRDGREVVVVSGSKSGAEVAIALGELLAPEEATHILAWLSIGGVHQGSPFADWALQPSIRWLAKLNLARQGFDLEGALSLQTSRRRPQFSTLRFPDHLLRISYVPVPLSGDISGRGRFGYGRLRHHGPNDGLTLLVDQLLPGGLTILEPKVDHYFDHPDQELRSVALLEVLFHRIGATESDVLRIAETWDGP